MTYVTANDAELRVLYEAARRVGYLKAAFNSFEDWCEKVGDNELDDARRIIALENEQEHKRLREEVIQAAKEEVTIWDTQVFRRVSSSASARNKLRKAARALIELEKRSVQPWALLSRE